MSANVRLPFEDFAYTSFAEYKATLPPGATWSPKLWKETMARVHDAWHAARKPKRKKPIADEGAWIDSLKADPALEGVDVDKEVAKCRFWCRNQTPPIIPTRRRIVNWLNKADRVVTGKPTPRVDPLAEPAGFREWFIRTRMGGEAAYRPWDKLFHNEKVFFLEEIAKEES